MAGTSYDEEFVETLEAPEAQEKKSNHQAKIVRLGEPRVHTNADSLELFDIPGTGYQVVTKKGQFKAGDLGVYIQPDSVVPQTEPFKFIWEHYAIEAAPTSGFPVDLGGKGESFEMPVVPEKKRRITVRKFRKEYSEGLLLPLGDFPDLSPDDKVWDANFGFNEGDDVSDLLGITHYAPPEDPANTCGINEKGPRTDPRRYPKSLKGWFYFILYKIGFNINGQINGWEREKAPEVTYPFYDVEALKNYRDAFVEGESVNVTEKIHGSNARYVFTQDKMFAGSRTLWKSEKSGCVWRQALKANPWIEQWCREHEGYALYGEVFPTQKGFDYGATKDNPGFLVFDVRTSDGHWLSKDSVLGGFVPIEHTVPLVGEGPFSDDLLKLADGNSEVRGAKNIREGIVIAPKVSRDVRGVGRLQLKLVSNAFYEKDSK